MSKKRLSEQELHNLAMNIVGKDLKAQGFEFLAVNSQLKRHPQFVCIDNKNQRYFVIVKAGNISDFSIQYDVIWMETIKEHARKNQAKVIFAGVGLGDKNNKTKPPRLNEEYLLQYEGLNYLDIELN
ncbi:Na(+)-translocating NADH-quinone reductase subunit F [uncultured Lutibacter sp.]|uniref:Na(+)-translocating NADH-quinone reductase subunit F n=1 Tax=uncultured Lutibacter sp. TaxID=437739 RepID=UPI002613AD0D|nr:Na(+)-translocating NADH-quinone reductase subunit F [uncultured Lutibacter sp.]